MTFAVSTLALVAALLAADGGTHLWPRGVHTVTAIATDYHLSLPDTLAAGATTFQLANHGREAHHLFLVRLLQGKTAADLVNAMKKGGPFPAWAVDMGGPNAVDPGGVSLRTVVALQAGHYAAICIVPGSDGVPHVMKGMAADLEVVPAAVNVSSEPNPDLTITLVDYGFQSSAPITSTTRWARVRNDGKQSHELVLARLLPGKSAADLARWAEKMQGPPPGHFLGGVSPIAAGEENDLSLQLSPGHYALLCFVPDARDAQPHSVHGMVHDLFVR